MSFSWQESKISHGALQLAVRTYGPESGPPVIALHGWLDNAASFELLAPLLPELRFIAIDMPGHGLSSWRGPDGGYYIWSYIEDVMAVMQALKLERVTLLGHSMGGAIAALFAALFPASVENLLLLDCVGPLATAPEAAPAQMLRALQQPRSARAGYRHYYPGFSEAVQARAAKGLSMEAATILGNRGIAKGEDGYYWTMDPRLSMANLLSLSEAQTAAFLQAVVSPGLLIAAPGYWVERREWFNLRCSYFQQLQVEELTGNHHQHLDGQVEAVAASIRRFLTL